MSDGCQNEDKGQRPPRPRKLTKHEVALGEVALNDVDAALQHTVRAQNALTEAVLDASKVALYLGMATGAMYRVKAALNQMQRASKIKR
jgi:hypothetical protein